MRVESEEYAEGTVIEVVQKGFSLDDRIIRPSMVKVAG
jgi:molecular chaperone GrpE